MHKAANSVPTNGKLVNHIQCYDDIWIFFAAGFEFREGLQDECDGGNDDNAQRGEANNLEINQF